ncbi:UDP-N-acetylmuramoyl-L-alanyl-D-glutamate--2,6-diaminopimelate ligase [Parabacteroides sp. TM07-1AC]|uniref:UDP-N-acetylmuramoyl-L-alanyl-D-glutamate--2, 6-diaminopimelate ligase n=1 Tax=Parabacteroides sp. TM07-1AC TaxID=2292363 RepID=UPI000EFED66C|nr:UDP-N-acetylmuramoyl-L-alanyl-D-glutamate--2,6-diaminopimelate ligase [Parabacteroides sp. TM07-1AC]RHU27922.1 UDP-N-acetylmuramoyl-L-alanyl-D-glutamate--2,6-diaminopimelate ligase [Parabacteroides sp. TM07-1AC]
MELKKLIHTLDVLETVGADDVKIAGIQSDSRKVEDGFLFVAVRGTAVDGHAYIDGAIAQGAVAIICEELPLLSEEKIASFERKLCFIRVKDSADALGKVVSTWYDNPSDKLTLVGVTGTNGKTTIATLLYEMFRKMGHKVGLISTVCNYIDGEAIPTEHTTPDPITLHSLMARMVEAGCEYAFMEVSSHSIDQKRISGLSFNGGIFTNLTRDHLDYHKTVENYLKAKKKFFDDLPADAFALTNADDKSGLVMLQNTAAKKLTYSLRTLADFKGKILESHFEGTEMIINGREVVVHFVGRFNAYNLLAVYGAAVSLGKDPEETLIVLSTLHSVSGRFETIQSPLGYTAIVDYAHTPDALTNVLNGIQEVLDGRGRIITVVGAGGNRDKGKRPLMAKEAAKLSDQVILTSDNPRFEEPDEIIQDMVAGLSKADMERTLCITDRTQAIKTATMLAKKGDVILVAGKGHEDYQDVKGVKHHFDDREKLREIFATQQQ